MENEDINPTIKRRIPRKSERKKNLKDRTSLVPPKEKTIQKLEQTLEIQAMTTEGRPTKAQLKELKLIEYLHRKGLSGAWVVDELNELRKENGEETFEYRTYLEWKDRFPQFFASIDNWKEAADKKIEASLMDLAMGTEVWEEKALTVGQGEGYSAIEKVKVKKKLAPNIQAVQFWLKNRMPHLWKDRKELEIANLQNLSDEELAKLVRNAMKDDPNK